MWVGVGVRFRRRIPGKFFGGWDDGLEAAWRSFGGRRGCLAVVWPSLGRRSGGRRGCLAAGPAGAAMKKMPEN